MSSFEICYEKYLVNSTLFSFVVSLQMRLKTVFMQILFVAKRVNKLVEKCSLRRAEEVRIWKKSKG